MSHLGLREYIAIAALLVATAISVYYVLPEDRPGSEAAPFPTTAPTEAPPPSPCPAPSPTATPIPPAAAFPPGAIPMWLVVFHRLAPGEDDVEVARAATPRLDFDIPGDAFGDAPDGRWRLTASARLEVPAAAYTIAFDVRGAARLLVDGRLAASSDDGRPLQARIEHGGGRLTLTIELTDGPGPALLRQR